MPTISTLTVDVESKTSGFTKGLKVAAGGLAALAAGAAFAFKQFEDAEKVQNQTAAVLESTGHAARISAKDVEGMAQRLSALTAVDDEVIQSGENMLLTFTNIQNKVGGEFTGTFDRATQVMLDMSVALGQDTKNSAIQLGKALNDPVNGLTALQRVGVTFTAQQEKQVAAMVKANDVTGAQALILDELTKEFGGSAEAQKTASAAMVVALGNLAETVGKLVAPAFEFLAEKAQIAVAFLQENAGPAFNALKEAVMPLVSAFTDGLIPVFEAVVGWFSKLWDAIGPVISSIGSELVEAAQQLWNVLSANVLPIAQKFWAILEKLWDILKPLAIAIGVVVAVILKLALEALPIVLQVLATLIEVVLHVVDAFLSVVQFVRDKFVEPIVNFLGRVIDKIGDVIGWVKERLVAAWDFIKEPVLAVLTFIRDKVQWVIDKVKALIDFLKDAARIFDLSTVFGQGGPTTRPPGVPVPGGASGGFVASSGLAVIHKGETLIPAGGMMSSGDIVLQVDGQTFARITRDQLKKLGNRNAGTGL